MPITNETLESELIVYNACEISDCNEHDNDCRDGPVCKKDAFNRVIRNIENLKKQGMNISGSFSAIITREMNFFSNLDSPGMDTSGSQPRLLSLSFNFFQSVSIFLQNLL